MLLRATNERTCDPVAGSVRDPGRAPWLVVRALLTAALMALPLHAQGGLNCRACGADGKNDCTKHGKGWLARERSVQFCSVAAECKSCGGALAIDCKQCKNPEAEKAIAERLAAVKAWREDLRTRIDEVAKGEPMQHLQTAHLDLSFGVDHLTVGRDKLDLHTGMHLYGERIEALRDLFVTTLQVEDQDFSSRLRVYVCRDSLQCATLAPRVTGIGGNQAVGTKLMGIDTVYCMWQNPRSLPDDEALHRNIVHNVTHLLLSNLAVAGFFGNPGNGWVDEGIAHWFEDKIGGKCTNFCFEEVLMQAGASFKAGRWRVPVRKMAEEGQLVSVATLGPKNSDQLTFPEHAQAFAMIDFLLTVHGGPKLRDFVRLLKDRVAMRDAMQKVYGIAPLLFDQQFDTWVKATYPLQESSR